MSQPKRNKLIVIGGPTASGKTSLAIEIAKHFQTEILSADSRQCYKELNIGVAKPSQEELQATKHHFINSHSIQEEVTAGTFMRYGLDTLENLFANKDVAICVGGTGLYINALCKGLDEIPTVSNAVKNEMEMEYKERGLEWLQKEVKHLDPFYYKSIDTQNPMRLLRGLIFFKSHNKSILQFKRKKIAPRPFDIEYYAIQMERDFLYKRINNRVEQMMSLGLLKEVENLKQYSAIKALQTVGYKELFQHLDGNMTLEKAVDKIKQHTRNYAKRQITWFKNQGEFQYLSAEKIESHLKSTNCR